ncbi:Dextranase [Bienertia sinuspersici]
MGGEQAENIASIIGYSGHERVDGVGFSGGIWVYWRLGIVTVNCITKHKQYINMEVKKTGETPWYFTAVYASPNASKRLELWEELRSFAQSHNKPWLIAGDFNDTKFPSERNSSCRETTRRSIMFNNWINEMDLMEVEFIGAAQTWARGNSIETRRSARLDRALCNDQWALKFQAARLTHENFKEFVQENWDTGKDLMPALSKLSSDLQGWKRNVFGNVFK